MKITAKIPGLARRIVVPKVLQQRRGLSGQAPQLRA